MRFPSNDGVHSLRTPMQWHLKTMSKLAALPLLIALLPGCFFDEVINREPDPGIRFINPGIHYIGDELVFDATKSIDDGSLVSMEWLALACNAEQSPRCEKIAEELFSAEDSKFVVPVTGHNPIEVQLRVRDELGAYRLQPDTLTVAISNRAPELDMQVQGLVEPGDGSYVVGLPIHLIGLSRSMLSGEPAFSSDLVDMDGDETTLTWTLFPPEESVLSARVFQPEGETGTLLIPDVAGAWSVQLLAEDAFGGSDVLVRDLFVAEDSPPCLGGMDPLPIEDAYYPIDHLSESRRFSVLSVDDVLDPFPASTSSSEEFGVASFRWLLQEPGSDSFVPLPGYSAASFLVDPALYPPGSELALRVEVFDRVVGPLRELSCAEEDWNCELVTGSSCFQRMTWGIVIQ